MDFVKGGNGFEFENEGIFDEDVGIIVADEDAVVVDRDRELGLDLEAGFAEFVSEGVLVDLFEKAAAEGVGDFDRAANDLFGQLFMNHRALLKKRNGDSMYVRTYRHLQANGPQESATDGRG